MLKDFPICISSGGHYGSSDLAESDSVPPTGTGYQEGLRYAVFHLAFIYHEG
jgi:hypothetical protein